MKFNLDNYKGNYCMHCKTLEEAINFCKFLDDNGRTWQNGDSYNSKLFYYVNENNTVIYFNKGLYGNIETAKDVHKCNILEWADYMEE